VFSGMIASTCLAVLFVPSFFAVIQRFEEWLKGPKTRNESLDIVEAPSPTSAE
jgi:HAE1 family hydrophobic/amphiphilic exporter-1